ncbi:MAG: hypothetical protein PHS86_04135 [Syntrophaceae bacterium]|nr:hypothetical protein [Syntrophaceae bacterium]
MATISIVKNNGASSQKVVIEKQREPNYGTTSTQKEISVAPRRDKVQQSQVVINKITAMPDEATKAICTSLKDEQVQIWCGRLLLPFDDTPERHNAWQKDVERIKMAAQIQAEVEKTNRALREAEPFYHSAPTTP